MKVEEYTKAIVTYELLDINTLEVIKSFKGKTKIEAFLGCRVNINYKNKMLYTTVKHRSTKIRYYVKYTIKWFEPL